MLTHRFIVLTFALYAAMVAACGQDESMAEVDAAPEPPSDAASPVLPGSIVGMDAGSSGTFFDGSAARAASDAGKTSSATLGDAARVEDAARARDATVPTLPADGMECSERKEACKSELECCMGLTCGTTSLGKVCCGEEGATCATQNGEDCCGALLCLNGRCGSKLKDSCEAPCTPAPALTLERQRLEKIGGSFLGICGDANHTYGFHVAAAKLPASDYSLEGAANEPICRYHAAAIDIGMDWPASRKWLSWLIKQVQSRAIRGVAEVIGSYDGKNVRYWSDSSGWSTNGEPYTGSGHDTWTHVSIHRSTALEDHRILYGWTANGGP